MTDAAQTMYSAFISYASADREKADAILASLEEKGLRCWIAPRDVRAGREYGEEIIRGIEDSRCLVLVLSEAANESTFVRREVERAVSKKKPVFPIRVEDVLPSPSLELFVASTHWIDAWSGDLVEHVDRLAHDLTDQSKVESATAVSRKIARRRRMPKWIVAGAAFAALVLAIVIGNALSRPSGGGSESAAGRGGEASPNMLPFGDASDWQGATNDVYEQMVASTGVDPATIKQEHLTVTPEVGAGRGDIGIKLNYSPDLGKLATYADLFMAIGDAEFEKLGTARRARIPTTKVNQQALAEAKFIRLRLDLDDGQTIGPFRYSIDPEASRTAETYGAISNIEKWVDTHNTTNLYLSPLTRYLDVIDAVRIGRSPDSLTHRIDIIGRDDGRERVDPYFVRNERPSALDSARLPPGVDEMYIQLEFTDGSVSEVRHETLSVPDVPAIELSRVDSQDGLEGPEVYTLFENQVLKFMPMSPPGTVRVQYSLDHGPFRQLEVDRFGARAASLFGRRAMGGTGDTNLAGKSTIQFLWRMAAKPVPFRTHSMASSISPSSRTSRSC